MTWEEYSAFQNLFFYLIARQPEKKWKSQRHHNNCFFFSKRKQNSRRLRPNWKIWLKFPGFPRKKSKTIVFWVILGNFHFFIRFAIINSRRPRKKWKSRPKLFFFRSESKIPSGSGQIKKKGSGTHCIFPWVCLRRVRMGVYKHIMGVYKHIREHKLTDLIKQTNKQTLVFINTFELVRIHRN